MKIGIFGGTFNPPHMGHVNAANAAVHALGLDILYFVPASIPPHKPLPEGSATPEQRLEMAALAAAMVPNACASGIELERAGPSYTVDTVREIAGRHKGSALWLIIGTDMLLSFERWREPRGILGMARLAVVCRSENDRRIIGEKAQQLTEILGARVDIIENIPFEVSSTEVRLGERREALPPAVAQYIAERGLYTEAELEHLREVARKRLGDARYAHTLGCEREAAALAAIYGENVPDARRAAILHDITKELTLEEQLQLCGKWGIIADYRPQELNGVIHADTGAELAQREFKMPRHICDAIKYHSTGRAQMSRLEKIIFVADKIEPTRTYADVPPIRETARHDLDCATLEVLRQSAASLERRGLKPHARTLEAIEDIKNRVKPD